MFRLFFKPPFTDPVLGQFNRVGTNWFARDVGTSAGPLGITLEGDRTTPSARGLEVARELLRDPGEHIRLALDFLRASSHATEFAKGNGEIVVDGFSIDCLGNFSVELSLSEWPDAMITVPFKEGRPCDVQLGD